MKEETKTENSHMVGKEITYREVFERSLDHLMLVDGHSGIILEINAIWEPTTGFTRDEIIGQHFTTVFADHQITTLEEFERVRTHDNVISTRLLKTRTNGPLPVEMWLTIVDHPEGEAILTVLRSIKERLETEEKMEEMNRRLQELIATKDKLFSIIAHDLKNQFHVLLAFSEILRQENDTLPTDERAFFIDQIESVSRSSHDLLTNLLGWARSQTGKLAVNKETLEINTLIRSVFRELQGSREAKELEFFEDVPPSLRVFSDHEMLKTVIRNLISNAIKFSHRGGRIEISVAKHDKVAEICIRDHGTGMLPEQAARMFEPGAESTPGTENEPGTGLGLTICKEFVEKLGGGMRCESAPGAGTSMFFTIELPQQQN